MISEWMKVMLEEIARKKAESEQARIDAERPLEEPTQPVPDAAPADSGTVRRAR